MKNEILGMALKYQEKGFSVIPIRPGKKNPLIKWEKFQTEKARPNQIREWWKQWPQANVAIITGAISGVDVVDIDTPKGLDAVNELVPDSMVTPIARSQKGGWHHYHEHQEGVGCATRFLTDTDLRGDGGYIIAPPSVGETGRNYSWLPGLSIEEVAPCPMPKPLYNKINTSLYRGGTKSQKDISHTKSQIVTSVLRKETGTMLFLPLQIILLKVVCLKITSWNICFFSVQILPRQITGVLW